MCNEGIKPEYAKPFKFCLKPEEGVWAEDIVLAKDIQKFFLTDLPLWVAILELLELCGDVLIRDVNLQFQ